MALFNATFPVPPYACLLFVVAAVALHNLNVDVLNGYPQWLADVVEPYIGFVHREVITLSGCL